MEKNTLFCIVVEDEPLAQQVLENYIHRVNELKLVATCESVEEAFKILKSARVDVVFLDLNLQANDGIDIIRKMNKKPSDRYYIIITSAVSPHQINLKNIFNNDDIVLIDHLTKPFSFERFMQAIQKITS